VNKIEKELRDIILEIVESLKKAGRSEAVVKWKYPELPEYFIELVITKNPE
jgi:hypothetical protein